MTEDKRLTELVLYAWVGEDEYGSGEIGLKRALTPAGDIPLVAVARDDVDLPYVREALNRQGRAFGKRIRLCKFVFAGELVAVGEPEKAPATASSERKWPELAGEISGFGQMAGRGFEYEAGCRRMVLAAADWLERHPRISVDWRSLRPKVPGVADENVGVLGNWEAVIRPANPATRELCAVMHAACANGEGDRAGPSYMMMAKALGHARYIKRHGWDAYVAMMAARRDGDEGVA